MKQCCMPVEEPETTEPAACRIIPVAPANGVAVSLFNQIQRDFLTQSRVERRRRFVDPDYRRIMASAGDKPQPTVLRWYVTGTNVACFTVLLSEHPDFHTAVTFHTTENEALIDNLQIASTYYWKVMGGGVESSVSSFVTEDMAPRLIRVDGIPNIRDLGGRTGLGGHRVRQGLIYRSTGLNDSSTWVYEEPEKVFASENGYRVRLLQTYQHELAELEQCGSSPATVPWEIGPDWIVFRPDGHEFDDQKIQTVEALSVIPETLFGAKSELFQADSEGNVMLPEYRERKLAILMQEFSAASDGRMAIACGGDWYWTMSVNGRNVFDCREGNMRSVAPDSYIFDFPVHRGANLIAVVLGSGICGWGWFCSAPRQDDPVRRAETRMAMLRKKIRQLPVKIIGHRTGRSRISEAAKRYMRETLGIRSDLDLRYDYECIGMTESPLGPEVRWFHFPGYSYKLMRHPAPREAFGRAFRLFLNRTNYPIDVHCVDGQDRTGAVAFILNALLGVSEEELYLDWEATGFWNPDMAFNHADRFDQLTAVFDVYPGSTIREKVEAYVRGCGFSDADIAEFRSIMLE